MYRLLAARVCLPRPWRTRIIIRLDTGVLSNPLNRKINVASRTPPPLQKKKEEERKKRDKNSRDIRIPKDVTSKILPYDIMNLFINGVPRDLDRQNNNCTHVQHTFFNIYLPTTTTTRRYLILRFMEDNIKQQQTGVRIEQGQWVGIVAIKIERTRICLLSEVLAASPPWILITFLQSNANKG